MGTRIIPSSGNVFRDLDFGDEAEHRREHEIDQQYERAYTGVEDPLGKDFEDWEKTGVWPTEAPSMRGNLRRGLLRARHEISIPHLGGFV